MGDNPPINYYKTSQNKNQLNNSTGSDKTEESSDDSDVDVTTVGDDSKFSFLPGFSTRGAKPPFYSSQKKKKRSSSNVAPINMIGTQPSGSLSAYLYRDKTQVIKNQPNSSSSGFTIDEI